MGGGQPTQSCWPAGTGRAAASFHSPVLLCTPPAQHWRPALAGRLDRVSCSPALCFPTRCVLRHAALFCAGYHGATGVAGWGADYEGVRHGWEERPGFAGMAGFGHESGVRGRGLQLLVWHWRELT